MERFARIREDEERALATLSDLRAMEDPMLGRLMAAWREIFRKTRALWGEEPESRKLKDLNRFLPSNAPLRWLRENLFSSVASTLVTVVLVYLIGSAAISLFQWAIVHAQDSRRASARVRAALRAIGRGAVRWQRMARASVAAENV